MVKCFRNVLSKGVAGTTRRDAPAAPIVGVGPEQVTHRALVGHLLKTIQGPDVIQGVNAWTETSMQTENLPIHQSSQGEIIEQVLQSRWLLSHHVWNGPRNLP